MGWRCLSLWCPVWARCSALLALVAALMLFAAHGIRTVQMQAIMRCRFVHATDLNKCPDALTPFGSHENTYIFCIASICASLCVALVRVLLLIRHGVPRLLCRCRMLLAAWEVRASTVAFGKAMWHRVYLSFETGMQDPETAQVWREVTRQRLRQAHAALNTVSLICVPCVLLTVARTGPDLADSIDNYEDSVKYLCDSEGVPLMFVAGAATLFVMMPWLVTPHGLNYANVLLSGMWAWKAAVSSEKYYDYSYAWILACRTFQGMILGNVWLTIFLHAVVSAIGIVVCSYYQHTPSSIQNARPYREVSFFLLMSTLTWTFEQIQLAQARAKVQARRSDHTSTLVYRILSCMCEAVVRLDADLRLSEPCPKLSSLLLRQGPLPPGVRFTDLMPPEDAQHVHECLECEEGPLGEECSDAIGTGPDSALAGLCHLRLNTGNTGNGSKLPVDLFYSCVPDSEGQLSYLIGIQEDREGQPHYPEVAGGLELASTLETRLLTLPEAFRREVSAHTSSWSVSERCGNDAEHSYMWVDARSSNLLILGCSIDVALLGGPSGPCRALSEWLSTSSFGKVCTWLAKRPVLGSCSVQLQPTGAGWTYTCRLSIDSGHPPPSAPSSAIPTCLVLKDLSFQCRHQSSRAHVNAFLAAGRAVHGRMVQSAEGAQVLALWISLTGSISGVSGGSEQLRSLFQRHRSLPQWLEQPDAFLAALLRILEQSVANAGDPAANELGKFVLRRPSADEPPILFTAVAELLAVSEDSDADFPCCIRLRLLQDLDQPVKQGDAAPNGSASVELDAQVLDCPQKRMRGLCSL
mmetsp:Transcript_134445/g.326755  ORF Transcript_134445/g.326755 Transcript_134445/m.326755 type:complete len:808 (+) Transcript_134445:67-2490(+)